MNLFTKKHGWGRLRDLLAENESFKNSKGTFRGEAGLWFWGDVVSLLVGRMDEADRQIMIADADHDLTYMVWSYVTPVAWRRSDGFWRVSTRNYSPTTAQHLGKLRTAVSSLAEQTA